MDAGPVHVSHTEESDQDQPTVAAASAEQGSGFTLIVAATGIVGIAGYLITALLPKEIGVASYAVFAVF